MSHLSSGDDVVLAIRIEDNQYRVHSVGAVADNPVPDSSHGLLLGEDTWIAVLSAQGYGVVDVHVQIMDTDPGQSTSGWEMVVERSLVTPSDAIGITTLYGTLPEHTLAAPSAGYRLRLHCAGRLRARQEQNSNKTIEKHLLQLWPESTPQPERVTLGPDEYGRLYLAS